MPAFEGVKWMIIVNPAAANGKVSKVWPEIARRLHREGINFSMTRTQYRGHATRLAEEAVQAGFRHLIAVGGDGTNHEVINGLLRQKTVPSCKIIYTLLPVGTGNDWVRTYGIPNKLDAWLDMLDHGHWIRQDAGLVTYGESSRQKIRYFVNVAGMAYDAFVVQFGETNRFWVRNRFAYLLLILRCLIRYRLPQGIIIADGQRICQRFYTINVGICRFSGGGMQLVPQALPDDGLLALTYAGPISKLGVLFNTWRFYNGSIGKHPQVTTLQVRTVSVSVPQGAPQIPLEADGEYLGCSPAQFSIIPDALTIIVPKNFRNK